GGVVGSAPLMSRSGLSPAIFAGAPRYHTGTVVGLRSDEQAAILQKGEEVLAKNNPRNILNGGAAANGNSGAKSGDTGISQVLVLDPDLIPQAMSGSAGRRVV